LDRAIQLKLRTLVGFLGERQQSDWWSSSFFGPASKGFITPIFGKDHHSAQLIGVTEAARRVHDALIGVGQVFHLFRLPEIMEQDLHAGLRNSTNIPGTGSSDEALAELRALSLQEVAASPGPVRLGPIVMLQGNEWSGPVAAHYAAAFSAGIQSFPYFSD
jgi:hypothetical protein